MESEQFKSEAALGYVLTPIFRCQLYVGTLWYSELVCRAGAVAETPR